LALIGIDVNEEIVIDRYREQLEPGDNPADNLGDNLAVLRSE